MGSGRKKVKKTVLHRGEAAVDCAWGEARSAVEELLRQSAERVARIKKIGISVEGLCEDVKLDPGAVWRARVRGHGAYQPIVERANGAVKALSICFYQQ